MSHERKLKVTIRANHRYRQDVVHSLLIISKPILYDRCYFVAYLMIKVHMYDVKKKKQIFLF